ncbi:MAG TPA: hypothetical protein DIT64_03645 [Verrucomicrobiales bacterium]|nr:hypothetical protein [Verrucomicrobiales bacterium]HRJ08080.1 hypothetical protein [Prosthecobacter sp.]HRK14717.1 hypothetical protein [Prosthecobacter sp.]
MKFLLASLLAALMSFAWGLLSREVIGWRATGEHAFLNESAVAEAVAKGAKNGRGIYLLPYPSKAPAFGRGEQAKMDEAHAKALKRGPYMRAVVRPGARERNFGVDLAWSFARSLACALVLAGLLSPALLNYAGRLAFCGGAGAFAGLAFMLPEMIHYELPARAVVVAVADGFVEWLLAGVVLACFVGREPTARDVV